MQYARCQFVFGLHLFLMVFVAGSLPPGTLEAQPPESLTIRTVRGLQQRRLYDLSILHAESAMQDVDLPLADRISLAVLVIESHSRRAGGTGAEARDAAWQVASNAARRYLTEFGDSPRSILLDVQSILVNQSRIEQLTREIDAELASDSAREEVQQLARSVQREFEQIQLRIAELINQPESSRPTEALTSAELLTLRYNVEYQAARMLMLGGMLYSEQASRDDVMQRVETQLQTVLQSIGPELPLWWAVQSDRLAAARIGRDWKLVSAIASVLPDATPDRISGERIQAELIQIGIARQQLTEALKIAGTETTASGLPELDLAKTRLFAVLATANESSTGEWQKRALDLAGQIEVAHGPYWGRRASLIVVGSATDSNSRGNLDLLIRVANEAQRKKQWPEALQALDAARQQAVIENNVDTAWKSGFRAAAIEQELQRPDAAARRYFDLASQFPEHPDAHAAHLMACWNYSLTIPDDPDRLAQYEIMLESNVQNWPRSSSADQTRIWLAGIRARQQEYDTALTLLLNVNPASPLYAASLEELRELLPLWIVASRAAATPTNDLLSAIARQLQTALQSPQNGEIAGNETRVRQQALLLLCELRWLYGVHEAGDLRDELTRLAEDHSLKVRPGYLEALQIVAAAWENSPLELSRMLLESMTADAPSLALLRDGLTGEYRDDSAPPLCQSYLLESAARFGAGIEALPDRQRYLWLLAQLDAARATGQPDLPEVASRIAERYPRDLTLQVRLGEILVATAASDPSLRPQALQQWRKIAALGRPQSEEWFTAKLQVARLLVDDGRRDEAKKMLDFMKAVPPGWTRSRLAPEFENLLSQLTAGQDP